MDEKIKISLSKTTLELLKKDCADFLVLKNNGQPNFNAFINILIANFYKTFSAQEENLHQELRNAISHVPDYYKNKAFDNLIKLLSKKAVNLDEKSTSVTFSFKPTKIAEQAIFHVSHIVLQNESISSFYRRMFIAYSRKTKNEREKIIHKENYETLVKATSLGVQVCVQLTSGQVINNFSVYSISPAKDELFNYVLGVSSNNVTIRLAKIKTIIILASPLNVPDNNRQLLDRQIACAPQYPMFSTDKHLIKVELTEKGKKLFEKIYLYRPEPINIEDNVYIFNCSSAQALYYFERFGNNALIISPRKLGVQMRDYHYFALKKYNSIYKEKI